MSPLSSSSKFKSRLLVDQGPSRNLIMQSSFVTEIQDTTYPVSTQVLDVRTRSTSFGPPKKENGRVKKQGQGRNYFMHSRSATASAKCQRSLHLKTVSLHTQKLGKSIPSLVNKQICRKSKAQMGRWRKQGVLGIAKATELPSQPPHPNNL